MLYLPCEKNIEQLRSSWDERTSPARFAGNDDLLDNIFVAKRKGDKVFLIRKARSAWDPFSTVFSGTLVSEGSGSAIRGMFRKRIVDYLILLAFAALDVNFYCRALIGGTLTRSLTGGCILFALALLLLAIPMKSAKNRYKIFLGDILRTELDT